MKKGDSSYRPLIERLYRELWNNPELTFREILKTMYIDKNMSIRDIAKETNCSPTTVHKWIKEEGLAVKKLKWK